MNIRPIRTEDDLTWALAEVEAYFLNEPEKGSADAARFEILADLIRAYETLHWSIDGVGASAETDKRFVHRGVAYGDLASVRTAIKNEQIAKMVRRRNALMGASSGRSSARPPARVSRARRSLRAG
jgi:HTH-type transcriptional regulator/antitoxin HigA